MPKQINSLVASDYEPVLADSLMPSMRYPFASFLAGASQFARLCRPLFLVKSLPLQHLAEWSPLARGVRLLEAETMLRITVDKNGSSYRLKLAGRLGGPWVPETEKAWRSALCSASKQIEIDMKELTAVDDEGRELLTAMHQAGARLVAQGVEMTALVEEIAGKQPPAA